MVNTTATPNAGAVLILALIAMSVVAAMSVMYLDISTAFLESQSLALNRLRAQALGDGALDIGIQALIDAPSTRGRLSTTTDSFGSYEITIANNGGYVDVVATCDVQGATAIATAKLELVGWTERRRLTFDNSAQGEDLIDFPVLVVLDTLNFDYTKTQDAGQDLRFADSDGSPLEYEIEEWNSSGTSSIWVKVPQVDGASNSDHIWMYYSNSSAMDGQNPTGVWTSNYLLVWHLGDVDGTATLDATAHGNNGTPLSTTEPQPTPSGFIGSAQFFDGNNDGIALLGLVPTVEVTLEAWVRPSGFVLDKWGTIAQFKDDKPFLGFCESPATSGRPVLNFWRGKKQVKGNAIIPEDSWSHVVATHDGSTARMYLNGVLDQSEALLDSGLGNKFYVGVWETGTTDSPFHGVIDEVRVSTTVRSPDWIAAQHLSMTDSFVSISAAESNADMCEVTELWRRTGI